MLSNGISIGNYNVPQSNMQIFGCGSGLRFYTQAYTYNLDTKENLQNFWLGNTAFLTLKSNLSLIVYSVLSTLKELSLVLQPIHTIQFL